MIEFMLYIHLIEFMLYIHLKDFFKSRLNFLREVIFLSIVGILFHITAPAYDIDCFPTFVRIASIFKLPFLCFLFYIYDQ